MTSQQDTGKGLTYYKRFQMQADLLGPLPPVPPLPELLFASSSAPMRVLSPPGGTRLGRPAGEPVLTVRYEFARVMVRPAKVILFPKRKAAVVLSEPTPKIPMPPRMPWWRFSPR